MSCLGVKDSSGLFRRKMSTSRLRTGIFNFCPFNFFDLLCAIGWANIHALILAYCKKIVNLSQRQMRLQVSNTLDYQV